MRGSMRIGKILGIPIWINYTWFIIFIFIVTTLALYYFPWYYPSSAPGSWSPLTYWGLGVATSLLFFASLIVHELAHSIVCVRNGIPVKSITLFIFGGIARISREATRPTTELAMAAAGPLASVAIAALFGGIWWLTRDTVEPLAAMAYYLALINAILAAFNMIPGYPLDGGRMFRSIMWWKTGNYKKATHIASITGRGIGYLFIVGGIFIMFYFGLWINGLWFAFIGWFLNNAASGGYRQALLREALQGFTARDLMIRDCPTVPPELTLRELVQAHILYTGRLFFLVSDHGRLMGSLTLQSIKAVPQERWDYTTVGQAMTPVKEMKLVHPADEAVSVLERMNEEDIEQLPVVDGERVVGLITRDSLLHFIRIRSELGK